MTARAAAVVLAALLTAGCTFFTPDASRTAAGRAAAASHAAASRALEDADAHAAQGDYAAALAAYDRYLARYADDTAAPRARAMQTVITEMVSLRAEVAALRERVATREAELSRARGDATELARLRHELAARQAEVTQLREDLEALKRTDLQMERRRR
jgi:hypothetical protein